MVVQFGRKIMNKGPATMTEYEQIKNEISMTITKHEQISKTRRAIVFILKYCIKGVNRFFFFHVALIFHVNGASGLKLGVVDLKHGTCLKPQMRRLRLKWIAESVEAFVEQCHRRLAYLPEQLLQLVWPENLEKKSNRVERKTSNDVKMYQSPNF